MAEKAAEQVQTDFWPKLCYEYCFIIILSAAYSPSHCRLVLSMVVSNEMTIHNNREFGYAKCVTTFHLCVSSLPLTLWLDGNVFKFNACLMTKIPFMNKTIRIMVLSIAEKEL